MDDVFFSQAHLIDPERCFEALGDVWVRKGRIVGVGPTASPPEGCGVVNCEGLCLAPGIVAGTGTPKSALQQRVEWVRNMLESDAHG